VFIVVGLPGLFLALLTFLVIREPKRQVARDAAGHVERVNLWDVLRYMWEHRALYFFVMAGLTCYAMGCYGALSWMPTFLQRFYAFQPSEAGRFLGTSSLALGIPATLLSGIAADKLLIRGRNDGHLIVGALYVTGFLICGAIAPIIPDRDLSLFLLAGIGLFTFTWTGVSSALLQIITPQRMRGQVTALNLFVGGFAGVGMGPTAVGVTTDYFFKSDQSVGQSIALVGIVTAVPAIIFLLLARKYMPADMSKIERAATAH